MTKRRTHGDGGIDARGETLGGCAIASTESASPNHFTATRLTRRRNCAGCFAPATLASMLRPAG